MLRVVLCLALVTFVLALSPANQDLAVQCHNSARGDAVPMPVPALLDFIWDPELAADAQVWANQCMFKHDPRIQTGGDLSEQGENLYKRTSSASATEAFLIGDACVKWEAEESGWDNDNRECTESATDADTCGHYTQMVWDTSVQLGCATKTCSGFQLVVCRYLEQGNFIDQNNVPVKPYETCEPNPCADLECGTITVGNTNTGCPGTSVNCGRCSGGDVCEENMCVTPENCDQVCTDNPGNCAGIQCGGDTIVCDECSDTEFCHSIDNTCVTCPTCQGSAGSTCGNLECDEMNFCECDVDLTCIKVSDSDETGICQDCTGVCEGLVCGEAACGDGTIPCGESCPGGTRCNNEQSECVVIEDCIAECGNVDCGSIMCNEEMFPCSTQCEGELICSENNMCIEDCTALCGDAECGTIMCNGDEFSCGEPCGGELICSENNMCIEDCTALCEDAECGSITCNEASVSCNKQCGGELICSENNVCIEDCTALCGNVDCGSITCNKALFPCESQCDSVSQFCDSNTCVDKCLVCESEPNTVCGEATNYECKCQRGFEREGEDGCVARDTPDYDPDFENVKGTYAIDDELSVEASNEVVIGSTQSQTFGSTDDLSVRYLIDASDGAFGVDFRRDDAGNRIRWLVDIRGSSADLYLCILSVLGGGDQCSSAVTVQLAGNEQEVEASIELENQVLTATIQLNGGLVHTANFPVSYFPQSGVFALMMSPAQAPQVLRELVLFSSAGDFAISLFPCVSDEQFEELYQTYTGSDTAPTRQTGENGMCVQSDPEPDEQDE